MAASYTLVYHGVARNLSRAAFGGSMQSVPLPPEMLSVLGLAVDSDTLANEGTSGVSRTIVMHPTGAGVLPNDQVRPSLENVLTSAISAACVSPVIADPVVFTP